MTRTLKIVKKVCAKRTTVMDTPQYNYGSPRMLYIEMPMSKPLPSTSCLNNLFTNLSVNRKNSKRVWGGIGPRTKRSMCLVSLLEECKQKQCDRMPLPPLDKITLCSSPSKKSKLMKQSDLKPSIPCSFYAETIKDEDPAQPIEF